MSNFERIHQAIVSRALIPHDDKQTMIDMFIDVNDEELDAIADLFDKKPEWVTVFNENRKKKQQAVASGDEKMWMEILEEEKKYMQDLMFDSD